MMVICQGTGNKAGPKQRIKCEGPCQKEKAETAYKWEGTGLSKVCRKCQREMEALNRGANLEMGIDPMLADGDWGNK